MKRKTSTLNNATRTLDDVMKNITTNSLDPLMRDPITTKSTFAEHGITYYKYGALGDIITCDELLKDENMPSAKIEAIYEGCEDYNEKMLCAIAAHKNTPIFILKELSNKNNKDIRLQVASNKECPTSILIKLAEDYDKGIRLQVALNENTPGMILRKLLVNDTSYEMKHYIACNRNIPNDVLIILANDEDMKIRWHVMKNESISTEILKKLAEKDPDEDIRDTASKILKERMNH
jgi:hypothetical protein